MFKLKNLNSTITVLFFKLKLNEEVNSSHNYYT